MNNKCIVCGKEKESKNPKVLYCSKKCRTKDLTRICPVCKKKFVVEKKSKKQVFCSKSCGVSHTNYQRGEEAKRLGKKYTAKRKKVLCTECGKEFEIYSGREQENNFCTRKCSIAYSKRNLVQKYCKNCDKPLPLMYASNATAFCCEECRSAFKRNPEKNSHIVLVKCSNCGKEIKKNISNAKNNKNFYCNRECFRESFLNGGTRLQRNNNDYQTFRSVLDSSSEGIKWKNEVLKKFNNKCSICNKNTTLVVHHIIPIFYIIQDITKGVYSEENIEKVLKDKLFNNINNGIVLCKQHHSMCHSGRFCEESQK